MRKILSIMVVTALVAMTMVSCKKDKKDDIVPQPAEIAINTLVYDGVTYQLHTEAILEGQSTYLSYFAFINDYDNFQGHIDGLNKTFDLTKAQDFMFDIYMYINETPITLTMYDVNSISGQIGETYYSGESIFSEGTFVNTYNNNDGVTCYLNGTLKNGKKLEYKVFVPESEIQRP
jgi:hypothetical protein